MTPMPDPIPLQEDLDIFSIQRQWEDLRARLPAGEGGVTLDLTQVGDLDLSGIQLLASLERTLRTSGRPFQLIGLKPEWAERFRRLGLDRLGEEGAHA